MRIALGFGALLLGGGGYYLWRIVPRIADRPFVAPTGTYGVGTREFTWTDSSKGEPYTRLASDHRTIVVQVWYPTERSARGDTARYLVRPAEFTDRLGAWAGRRATTNSIVDAPIAGGEPFPVILHNHGGNWTRWSSTFFTEWLASYGYVVFSVEHYGFNQTSRYPDGTRFAPDTLEFPKETGDLRQDALRFWGYLDDAVFPVWKSDAGFALDHIEELNRDAGPFQGHLDLARVGMVGWSFGGALAVQMSADDPRVLAAVDHDGQLFGDVRQRGTTRPVLLLHHGVDDALDYPVRDRPLMREFLSLSQSWDSTARAASTSDWYQVTIAGTDHGDFSDLALFYHRGNNRLDPRRGHQLINDYTLAFFDQYLKGRPSDLLSGTHPSDPAVTFRAWPGRGHNAQMTTAEPPRH